MGVLPSKDRKHLVDHDIPFDEIVGPPKAVILRSYGMPPGRFNCEQADILILLPDQYPDVRPDMFFALPWLSLANGNRYPKAADQPHQFEGQNWQRWSRHSDQWRPGIDGIWTMLRRIDTALEVAA
jgi:hypothetical protein